MAVIVVTRLRLKNPALLDEFFTDAVAAIEQAQKSEGNLGADALADADNAWWSVSSWQARGPMQAFVDSEPHRTITTRLDHYCDEATFVELGAGQPGSAGLADELAAHHRRRPGGRAHGRVTGQPDPRLPPAGRASRRRHLTAGTAARASARRCGPGLSRETAP